MRRIEFMLAVGTVIASFALGALAQSESLGDAARAARKQPRRPAKMVYTNDNLPTTSSISVVGAPPVAAAPQQPATKLSEDKAKSLEDKAKLPAKDGKPEEQKTAPSDQVTTDQLTDQKKKIADLEKDLDLLQREYKLQVADYYADAGTQLRDPKKWAEQETKFRTDIADRQKQVDEAKAQLQDMEEQARKAGTLETASQ